MAVKYVALDLHQASTSISVRDARGRVIRREVVPTSAAHILEAINSAGGSIHVTFEEGTLSQWIYDQLVSRVARVIVCNPRHKRLLAAGNKSDRIDADKLSDLLRLGALRSVYHERSAVAALGELVRSDHTLVEDSTRVMLRIKAIFRARAIDCSGIAVYHPKNRPRFLAALSDRGARLRAEHFYLELDGLLAVRAKARHQMLEQAKRHPAVRLLRSIPFIGPVRAAEIVAIVVTPERFRTRRQLWPYAGLAVTTRSSADHRFDRHRGAQYKNRQSKPQPELQSHAEEGLQGGGRFSGLRAWSVARLLRASPCERHASGACAAHHRSEDCFDRSRCLEERSAVRSENPERSKRVIR